MKYLLGLFLSFTSSFIFASPFVQVSVVVGVTSCGFTMDATPKVFVAPVAGLCKLDIAGISTGSHSVTATALSVGDPVFGSQESAPSSPLAFVKPSVPPIPTGLQLVP